MGVIGEEEALPPEGRCCSEILGDHYQPLNIITHQYNGMLCYQPVWCGINQYMVYYDINLYMVWYQPVYGMIWYQPVYGVVWAPCRKPKGRQCC